MEMISGLLKGAWIALIHDGGWFWIIVAGFLIFLIYQSNKPKPRMDMVFLTYPLEPTPTKKSIRKRWKMWRINSRLARESQRYKLP